MKKIFILACAAFAAFSCMMEFEDPQTSVSEKEYKTITFDVMATKTVVDDEGQVEWEANDEISLYYINEDGVVAESVVATADAAGSTVSFTAQIPVEDNPVAYYAAYPKGVGELTADGQFSINLAADKCDGTFKSANYAVAYTSAEDMALQFCNAVAMVKVSLPEAGVITRAKDNSQYHISGIYIRGKETGPKLQGKMTVQINDGAITGFGEVNGASNVNMTGLSEQAINSGVVYVPCAPAVWTDGICVRYLSSDAIIPAILSKDGKEISVERGHILPIADLSSKVVFDYYVSASGTGNGLTEAAPMGITAMQELLNTVNKLHPTSEIKMQYPCYRLNGTTFNFVSGTHNVEQTITIPAGSIDYRVFVDGGNNTVLQGSTVKVFAIEENATISNLTIQGADVSTSSGVASNGAGITVNAKTKVTLENVTIQNCKAKSGGALFVRYNSATATDTDSVLDCVNCKFITNSSTGNGGAIVTASTSAGGVIRFDRCYFKQNKATNTTTTLGGVLYSSSPVFAMFNKCTFYENASKKYAQDIYMDAAAARLALNNCTFRVAARNSNEGTSVTTRGYSVIANTTFWSTGAVGPWGLVGLGSKTSNANSTGSIVVNCFLNNKSTVKEGVTTSLPAFYYNSGFYQNVKYCIYTGDNNSDSITTVSSENNTNLGTGTAVSGASTKSNVSGPGQWYYAYTWPWQQTYPCPTLAQVRTAIKSNTQIGETFLDWLDTIEGALSTDIAGNPRPSNAMCPGSYQQTDVVAKDN